jgi:thiopeptide-type bacteriocin biosynthesis protein
VTEVWVYFKAYAGGTIGGVEQLVADTIPAVLSESLEVDRWFFLRYTDDGGGHLRLRMRVAPEARETIERILRSDVSRLSATAFPLYRPTIDASAFGPAPVETRPARVESATYQPEFESFGVDGMEIAEALFQRSSDVAVKIVNSERAGRSSRKTLAPIFMRDTLQSFAGEGTSAFWRKYAHHWLLYRNDWIEQWLPRFEAKHAQLAAASVPVIAPDEVLSEDERAAVNAWRAALADASLAYATVASRPPGGELAFRFMHLMNNRLGLYPAEEAYFATLIRCDEEKRT